MEISEEQLAQIKAHLKVDGDDEDTLIAAYASASVDYVERFCDGALVETLTPPVEGETQPREVIFTSGIWAAMLLLIGHCMRTAKRQRRTYRKFRWALRRC